MVFEPTATSEFEVRSVGPLQRTANNNPFIECKTSVGTVAFWGGRSMENLTAIQRRSPPFRVRCGCRPPMRAFPFHDLWVPESARVEFLGEDQRAPTAEYDGRPDLPSPRTGGEQPVLYVVNCTKAKIWDDDPLAPAYVPAQNAYRGSTVRRWLASVECQHAQRWVFLSAKYGFIEPDHPIGKYDVTFSELATGPITDEYLRAQVHGQRRWEDRVPLRDFRTVYVWSESATYEEKVRVAFDPVGARVLRVTTLTALK